MAPVASQLPVIGLPAWLSRPFPDYPWHLSLPAPSVSGTPLVTCTTRRQSPSASSSPAKPRSELTPTADLPPSALPFPPVSAHCTLCQATYA